MGKKGSMFTAIKIFILHTQDPSCRSAQNLQSGAEGKYACARGGWRGLCGLAGGQAWAGFLLGGGLFGGGWYESLETDKRKSWLKVKVKMIVTAN